MWTYEDLNLRPLPYQRSALTGLSYTSMLGPDVESGPKVLRVQGVEVRLPLLVSAFTLDNQVEGVTVAVVVCVGRHVVTEATTLYLNILDRDFPLEFRALESDLDPAVHVHAVSLRSSVPIDRREGHCMSTPYRI